MATILKPDRLLERIVQTSWKTHGPLGLSGTIWTPFPVNEPIFIVRAQDIYSHATVREWMAFAKNTAPHAKLIEAFKTSEAMLAWPNQKIPD